MGGDPNPRPKKAARLAFRLNRRASELLDREDPHVTIHTTLISILSNEEDPPQTVLVHRRSAYSYDRLFDLMSEEFERVVRLELPPETPHVLEHDRNGTTYFYEDPNSDHDGISRRLIQIHGDEELRDALVETEVHMFVAFGYRPRTPPHQNPQEEDVEMANNPIEENREGAAVIAAEGGEGDVVAAAEGAPVMAAEGAPAMAAEGAPAMAAEGAPAMAAGGSRAMAAGGSCAMVAGGSCAMAAGGSSVMAAGGSSVMVAGGSSGTAEERRTRVPVVPVEDESVLREIQREVLAVERAAAAAARREALDVVSFTDMLQIRRIVPIGARHLSNSDLETLLIAYHRLVIIEGNEEVGRRIRELLHVPVIEDEDEDQQADDDQANIPDSTDGNVDEDDRNRDNNDGNGGGNNDNEAEVA